MSALVHGTPALALHEESPPAIRLTSGDTHEHPYGRSWGNWFAFSSAQDLLNIGAARAPGKQVYVFNLNYFDCYNGTTKTCEPGQTGCQQTPCPPPGTPYLRQVTNGPGDPDNPVVGNEINLQPGQTAKDHWIAFDALGSFNGNTGAAAARRQIFLKNITTSEIRQVTTSGTGDSTRPTVNELAGIVVFESTANPLAGFPNPAGVKQVYLFQRGTGFLARLSVGPAPGSVVGLGAAENPVINQNGTGIVFQSSSELFGDGHDTGVSQIYHVGFDKNDHVLRIHQVTAGNLSSSNPYIGPGPTTGSPPVVVFDSYATDLPGAQGLPGRQIYEATLDPDTSEPSALVSRLTLASIFGDCLSPHIDPTGNRIGFICVGDPLQNSTTGNRLFILDRPSVRLYQMTGTGELQPNFGQNLGQWFVTLGTTTDLTGGGACGSQLYILDYAPGGWQAATSLGQVPPDVIGLGPNSVIGLRNFEFKPGDPAPGSEIVLTTTDGATIAPITGDGRIIMKIGAPDEFTREAPIEIEGTKVKFPPMAIPGLGALCLTPDGDGQGAVDCDGGRPLLDIGATRDHHINDIDPFCLTGCHEDAPCRDHYVPVPHRTACPICSPVTATCDIGFYTGEICDPWPTPTCSELALCYNGLCPDATACNPPDPMGLIPPCQMPALCDDGVCPNGESCLDPDLTCQTNLTCVEDSEPVCNGPLVTTQSGVYDAGGIRVTVPVRVTLSQEPGLDDTFCTGDDEYGVVQNLPLILRLTTGTATASVADANDVLGTSIAVTETGTPIDCTFLRLGDLAGTRFIGTLQYLDIPLLTGLRDIIISLRFEAKPGVLSSCSPTCTTSLDCDDGDVCNGVESCISSHCALGTALVCTDGDACNGLEICDPLAGCGAGTPPDCDDLNVCTDDSCDPLLGCQHVSNSSVCDDGNPCTTGDTCAASACVGTAVNCSDNDACNGSEVCDPTNGVCQPGTPPNCDDANACTDDACDPTLGCTNTNNTAPCDDASLCTENDACSAGACTGTPTVAAALCNAGNGTVCDGTEVCNPLTGACDPGTPLDCDDVNPCTDDSCDPIVGCQHVNNTDPCSDASACTTGDVCTAGACVGTLLVCGNGTVCDGIESCNPASGCELGAPLDCDDLNPCTDDSCDPLLGCQHVDNANPCSDGTACTTGDTCTGGACVGAAVTCDDGDACNGVETCDAVNGCVAGAPPVCDDTNACTDDSCTPLTGCVFTNNTSTCDDTNACTTSDTCSGGACIGVAVVCSDNDACNGVETCNPTTGLCDPGVVPSCGDNNACTDDSCDPGTGCVNAPNTDPCDDASACTSGDACSGGACVGTTVPCDDGNACNGGETCDPGLGCQIGTTPNCNDGDACTGDSCDPLLGCVNTGFPNLAVCRIIALINATNSYSDEDLGGQKKRLLRKAQRALEAAQRMYTGNPRLQRSNARRATRRLAAYVRILRTGLDRGTVDPAAGDVLLQLASDAAEAVATAIP